MAAAPNLQRVPLVFNPKYQKSGLKSYGYLLRKYNIQPTNVGPFVMGSKMQQQGKFKGLFTKLGGKATVQRNVLQKKDLTTGKTGQVTGNDIQNDSMYLCQVGIGTPPQNLMLDFDTGSADLWVWSSQLPQSTLSGAGSHNIFDPTKSSTFSNSQGSTWQIQYGDGSTASGTVGTDQVDVGGLVINAQAVELSNQLSQQFQSGAGDGLLGLAFGKINTVKPTAVATPVENMISQQDITQDSELFTAYLGSWRDANAPDKGESFYTFGYIDQTVLTASGVTDPSTIWYTPIDNSQGFWQFQSTSATVNGTSIDLSGNSAIADTGTTLALVSDSVCQAIYKAIPGGKYDQSNQGYIFPANTTADQLPVVQFDVGGKLFAVQKEDLGFADAGNGMVYGGIQSRGNMTFDILGDTFLKGIYAIFDQGKMRFGAVQRVEQTQNTAPPPAQGQ